VNKLNVDFNNSFTVAFSNNKLRNKHCHILKSAASHISCGNKSSTFLPERRCRRTGRLNVSRKVIATVTQKRLQADYIEQITVANTNKDGGMV